MPGWTRRGTIAGLVAASALPPAFARTATARDFHDLAPRPPMGWNSWDSFAATLNEAQARETAAIMAEKLLPAGYANFHVNIKWYESCASGFMSPPGRLRRGGRRE